ncbi:MAG: MerC domain-containing protein [Actinomycetota bacterium]|nr:MerC domain-containing protein [Actinomycetota bacterium]
MRAGIFGSLGSAFAALCCAGAPAVLGALSAAGLGFLINDLILFPLLALFVGLGLWGLWDGVRRHGSRAVLAFGGLGAALMVAGILASPVAVYAGAAAMIAASVWNALAIRQTRLVQ